MGLSRRQKGSSQSSRERAMSGAMKLRDLSNSREEADRFTGLVAPQVMPTLGSEMPEMLPPIGAPMSFPPSL
jgi:hypothetical protein